MAKFYAAEVDANGDVDSPENYQSYETRTACENELEEMGYDVEGDDYVATDKTASEAFLRVRIIRA